jgi:hypothetical protein
MTELNKVYARIVVGEIIAECESPPQAGRNGELAIEMMGKCQSVIVKIIEAQRATGQAPEGNRP